MDGVMQAPIRVFEGLGHFSILTKAVEVTSELVVAAARS